MNETVAAIDMIALRIPLDIWPPAPMAQRVQRTHVESLYVCVTTARERMFAGFGATPSSRTVPVIHGGVEVPQGPGLGAEPEDDLISKFRL